MAQVRFLVAASSLTLFFSSAFGADVRGPSSRALRVPEGSAQKPHFKQQLLLCNAYPSIHAVQVQRNAGDVLVSKKQAIPFRQCRYVEGEVQRQDRLDFSLADSGVEGMFQVGELPATDAVLLLVLEKRDPHSTLVSFQSFAFPTAPGTHGGAQKDAQLAVVDAFRGNASMPRLKMEDHIMEKEDQTVSKRVELLSFNRVYSVEEGDYDASIADHSQEPAAEALLEQISRKTLKLARSENYVVLRTGDGAGFKEGITVFPELKSGAARFALGSFGGILLSAALAALSHC